MVALSKARTGTGAEFDGVTYEIDLNATKRAAPAPPAFPSPDADRRLTQAPQDSPNQLAADALLLQRACGLRIGELLDLEMDAVIDIPGSGSWLKVPLGKLDTERMVPIDTENLALIDQITTLRSPGRPADFLFTAWSHRSNTSKPTTLPSRPSGSPYDTGRDPVPSH